ncbi:UDP-glucose/GDP-mannose dehydrogenase family protein [Fulvivirgaceae bacterium BMA10]|uniref:UDP-glucose 6-dehydrogenase n=1 Tax=Splendidivirga corallicola TaxID=3051826 RepID=A0ABT8KHK9_9BACT|nr:UDP-glucose/GDP-mannose dehydrogenase family protein [Fulvivirgaceae bacterium BMA10]
MKIVVVGTGYVGLVTGTCFAEVGIDTTCIDIDQKKIDKLRVGEIPIFEPGLEEMVKRNTQKKRLHFETDIAKVLDDAEVVFIAVGTPPDEDGSADLKHVLNVAKDIGNHMSSYTVVVTKSTVPVGTAKKVNEAIQKQLEIRGEDISFDVASNPEFLKEGAAIEDFMKPDRIVVGVESDEAKHTMKQLYKPFMLNGHPIIFMDVPSAEMTKYAANAMLATKISFMNDIANLCEILGANVNLVRKGIGSDPRIGSRFIYPGIGYGGSCFPKDVKALIKTAEENDYKMRVLEAVESVNEHQKTILYQKVENHFGRENLKGKKIAIWGLSFKPQTNDMREAPSVVLIKRLLEAGCKIAAYDPVAKEEAREMLGDSIEYKSDQYEVLINADCLLIVTEWSEFRFPNYRVMEKLMAQKLIFDGRNILDIEKLKSLSFNYHCIGLNAHKLNGSLELVEVM